MRMNTTSNYNSAYKWNNRKPNERAQPIVRANNLKTEPLSFTGASTYAHDFTTVVKAKPQ